MLTLLAWRRQFPPELLATQPQVQLATTWGLALAIRFDEAKPLLEQIEQEAHKVLQGQALHDTLGECLAIRAVTVALQDDTLEADALASAWQSHFSHGDAFAHNSVSNVMRYVHWKAGRLVQAYEQPWRVSEPDKEQQIAFSTVYRHTILGNIELQQARLGLAERHARQAMHCANTYGKADSVSAALAAPLMAMIQYQQDRQEQAEQLLTLWLPLLDSTAMLESMIQAYQVLVNVARHQNRPALAFEYLERAEAIGYNRGWDRLVANMLLERVRLLIAEQRIDEASATTIRLKRLALGARAKPQSAHSDLLVLRDIALARLALADQRIDEARQAFSTLLHKAQETAHDLRALQLGSCLVMAHMAAGDQAACFDQLRSTLRAVQKSGALRSLLDEDTDLPRMLVPFLVSDACDDELTPFVRTLLTQQPATDKPHDNTPEPILTTRECDILDLVSRGLSNKEIARQLDISAETVKSHLKNTFEKLDVQRRAQAVLIAQSLDLIPS